MTSQNVFDRSRVIALRGEGLTYREIDERVGHTPAFVGYTLKRWNAGSGTVNAAQMMNCGHSLNKNGTKSLRLF